MLDHELIPAEEKNSKHLMIMLPGLGDSIQGYRWLPEAMDLPWMNYVLVNAPDEYYGGYAWFEFEATSFPACSAAGKCCSSCSTRCALRISFGTNDARWIFARLPDAIEAGLRYRIGWRVSSALAVGCANPEKLTQEISPSPPAAPADHARTLDPLAFRRDARTREHPQGGWVKCRVAWNS
jgi:hypothetical protein